MNRMMPTQNRPEATRSHEMNGTGASALVVLGTTEDVKAGSVLMKSNVRLPEFVRFESKRYGSWKLLTESNGVAVKRILSGAGWHFFFMVPGIRVSALSSDRNKALRRGLKKVLTAAESRNFNALEIVEITTKRFLGLYWVRVVAHPRHVKHSPFLRDLDPYHTTRNVWDSKQVLRRRAQIGHTPADLRRTPETQAKEGRMNHSDRDRLHANAVEKVEASVETQHVETREEQNHHWVSEDVHQLKENREYALDNTLSETFPCSDPLSSIPNPTSRLF